MLEVEAHERYAATVGRPSKSDQKIDQISERVPQAAEQAATIVGTNRQYVADMKRYKEQAPEVFDLARAGTINGSGARKLASLNDDMRSVVVDKLRSGRQLDLNA